MELGHIAKAKDIPTLDGHTHDWIVFVKGADGIKIEYFVEKVGRITLCVLMCLIHNRSICDQNTLVYHYEVTRKLKAYVEK